MLEIRWNDDIAYVFSIHRAGMWVLGTWPLLKQDLLSSVRWIFICLSHFTVLLGLIVELYFHQGNAGTTMDGVLLVECIIIVMCKHIFLRVHLKQTRENVLSAFDDWWYPPRNKEELEIMKNYARTCRILTVGIMCSGILSLILYILGIVAVNMQQNKLLEANEIDGAVLTVERNFIFPASWLTGRITNTQYFSLFVVQIAQSTLLCMEQNASDSFFFIIVMHLAGQIRVLNKRFRVFGENWNTEDDLKKELGSLVRKHCSLIYLVKNLQRVFGIILLVQLGLSAVLMAITGIRFILSIRHQDGIEFVRSIGVLLFIFMQSFMYVYAADFLVTGSEEIFQTVFGISWYTFPPAVTKDLCFVMARMRDPLRLNGGKFFYISRRIMMDIFRTAASYVSVLQMTIQD